MVPEKAQAQANEIFSERSAYFDRLMDNVTLTASLREDIEQLFTLQTLQRYKSESLTRMRWTMSYFMLAALLQVGVLTYVVSR